MHRSGNPTRSARLVAALCAALAGSGALASPAARDRVQSDVPASAREHLEAEGVAARRPLRLAAVDPGEEPRAIPELRYKDTPPPAGLWRRPAGKWLTLAGAVLFAGGFTVAAMNKQVSDDLHLRYRLNTLTPADASKYDQVDTYNTLTTVLLASGAAAASVGVYLWSTAPDDPRSAARRPAALGVQGRF